MQMEQVSKVNLSMTQRLPHVQVWARCRPACAPALADLALLTKTRRRKQGPRAHASREARALLGPGVGLGPWYLTTAFQDIM